MSDFRSRPSMSSQHNRNDSNGVIVLSSDSSEDETDRNRPSTQIRSIDEPHRPLNASRNGIIDLTQSSSQRTVIIESIPTNASNESVSSSQHNSNLQCHELVEGLHSLMREMEVLERKFSEYKQKEEHRNENEASLANSKYNESHLNTPQNNKSVDENSHSSSETTDSFKKEHKSSKRKYHHRCKSSHSHRKRHASKRKRKKCCRKCIRCERKRPNCEIYASVRENDMKIRIKKVAFNFNSSSEQLKELENEVDETQCNSSVDNDKSSEQDEQFIPEKSTNTQGKHRQFKETKRGYPRDGFQTRLSDEMVQKLKRGDHPVVRYDRPKLTFLAAFCYFCESLKRFPTDYWVDHIRSHTLEYAYKCLICMRSLSRSRLCCSRYAVKIIITKFAMEKLVAYLCKICNFVQISEKNMQKHLKNEHQSKHDQYEQVTLLPAFKSVKQPILKLHDIRSQL